MSSPDFTLHPETVADAPDVEALIDRAFGPGRFARTAQRLRDGVPHCPDLSLIARFGDRLGGSVRLTPIVIGTMPALLLGPLAVHPDFEGQGAGRALVRHACACAAAHGWAAVLLVGDRPYYVPLGFAPTDPAAIRMPGPVDPGRVLLADLRQDRTLPITGLVGRTIAAPGLR